MIPNTSVAKVTGSLGGRKTKMGFAEGAEKHLMSLLTRAYTDPEGATIREYATNAIDSHIFAGQSRPVEITTPSTMSNNFVVQDFGLGMDAHDMETIYCKYGASTKRTSNAVAGQMGIGSKSALAYTNTFTVIGVKDGIKTTAVIYKGEDGAGIIEIISEKPTDEGNGVTVSIPAKQYNEFDEKADTFFSYWDEGLVLLNGKAPRRFTSGNDYSQVDEIVWARDAQGYCGKTVVVMGNVSYVHENNTRGQNGLDIVARIDVGDVDFVPNREALELTPRTKTTLKELEHFVSARFGEKLQSNFDESANLTEAIANAEKLRNYIGYERKARTLLWQGIKIIQTHRIKGFVYRVDSERCSGQEVISTTDLYSGNTYLILNKPRITRLSNTQRQKLSKYADENSLTVRKVHYFDGELPEVFSEALTIDWADIDAIQLPKAPRKPRAKAVDQTWEYHYPIERAHYGGLAVTQTIGQIPDGVTVTYAMRADFRSGISLHRLTQVENVVVVNVGAARLNTFKKAFPDAVLWSGWIERHIDAELEKVTDLEREAYSCGKRSTLKDLAGKTTDTHIDTLANVDLKRISKLDELCYSHTQRTKLQFDGVNYLDENYPLISKHHIEHSILYVNVVHAYKEATK